jgi:hypothetical protein
MTPHSMRQSGIMDIHNRTPININPSSRTAAVQGNQSTTSDMTRWGCAWLLVLMPHGSALHACDAHLLLKAHCKHYLRLQYSQSKSPNRQGISEPASIIDATLGSLTAVVWFGIC